ncbi:MAG TPA: AraC family transcriptional regulator [Polyangia bacterium]|nr:AraC family transcriptional regulator [Polyangia bacterium]
MVRNLGGSIRRDFLGEVLQSVRFRSTVLCRAELSAPWGFTVPRRDSAGFHIVLSGRCCLEAETVSGRLWLARGDLVILPHGSAHTVRDAPGSVAPQLEDMVARSQTEPGGRLHAGGGGVRTVLVCGGLDFEERATNPLLLALPPLIHLRGRRPSVEGWLNMTFDFLERESRARRPGADAVITRLADVLFIEAVRSYFASAEAGRRGLAAALRDPRVGTALRSIHRRPEAEWEVGTLARQAGMSRTTFATRFAALVGEPPLHYVTRCRMDKAVALLRGTTATTAEIAERVGYQSERGFARAFKRFVGAAPSSYRRRPKRSRGG